MHALLSVALLIAVLLANGCINHKVRLVSDTAEPLKEYTLEGKGKEKVLLVPIRGFISDTPKKSLLRSRPSMVQEVAAQLQKAEKDKNIKAVLLKVDSPGGTTTASDILYHELLEFKQRTGKKMVVVMMDVAASGGYYISLPADLIVAHPTTVTGSVGVIFLRPKVSGLLSKLGVTMELNKSGKNKDMGSPFREATEEEQRIFQGLIDGLDARFKSLVAKHRQINRQSQDSIASARIYLADEALQLGLIDEIGYLEDAVSQAKKLAGLPEDARLVVYRRSKHPDDNLYNTAIKGAEGSESSLIDLDPLGILPSLSTGFYYLWLPNAVGE